MRKQLIITEATHEVFKDYCKKHGLKMNEKADKVLMEYVEQRMNISENAILVEKV